MRTKEDQELVPLAERVDYVPDDFVESHTDTVWFNPTERDAVLELHVGTNPMGPNHPPRPNSEQRTGIRKYKIKSKARRALPSEFDIAIQHLVCDTPYCPRKNHCGNPDHNRLLVGGLGPQLVNMGLQKRPALAFALNEAEAEKKIAMEIATKKLLETRAAEQAMVIAQAQLEDAAKRAEQTQKKSELEKAELQAELRAMKASKQNQKD